MDKLIEDYARILRSLDIRAFSSLEDKYSGVFLPLPFEQYWESDIKIMLVGRETAGWNTANNKNKIKRVAEFVKKEKVLELICEATSRYKKHLPKNDKGKTITKTRSRFKQYFFRLAKELEVKPEAIIYGNLFAWDYDKKTPRSRPKNEVDEITSISKKLLAAQISRFKPDVIVFAAGFVGVDKVIRELLNENFDGYKNGEVISGKYWEFKPVNDEFSHIDCFRIAHPRATHGHAEFRDKVIYKIKTAQGENRSYGKTL